MQYMRQNVSVNISILDKYTHLHNLQIMNVQFPFTAYNLNILKCQKQQRQLLFTMNATQLKDWSLEICRHNLDLQSSVIVIDVKYLRLKNIRLSFLFKISSRPLCWQFPFMDELVLVRDLDNRLLKCTTRTTIYNTNTKVRVLKQHNAKMQS